MPQAKYFKKEEFTCHCGCGQSLVHDELLGALDAARGLAGIPFVVTSGYRCLKHNREVGSQDTSSHVKGYAADITCRSDSTRMKVLSGAILAGIRRIGIYPGFIHLDVDPDKPAACWLDLE